MNYINRISKYLFLFFISILILCYPLLFHTDKVLSYFSKDIIEQVNAIHYIDDFNINGNIEGSLISSLKINNLSFSSNNRKVEVEEYSFETSFANISSALSDYLSSTINTFPNLFRNSNHSFSQLSVEDKNIDSFLAVPAMIISKNQLSLDTLFVSYQDYVIFGYNINSDFLEPEKESYYSKPKNLKADSLEIFIDDKQIEIKDIFYQESDNSIAFSNLIGDFIPNEKINIEKIELDSLLIKINNTNQSLALEVQNSILTSSYFENLLIDSIYININGKDSSGYLDVRSANITNSKSSNILLNDIKLNGDLEKNNQLYTLEFKSIDNNIYINGIKYHFKYKINYLFQDFFKSDKVEILFFDGYNYANNNFLNLKGNIDLNENSLSLNINTSNFSYLGVSPKTSKIDINSYDLTTYIIDYKMYKVGNLVKKRFDKLSGQSTIIFKNSLNDYVISSTPIFITDKSYNGAIDIPIINDISDFKFNVKSSFVNILKKNKLETVD